MAPCDFKDRKDNVYTQCILSNTIRTYSLQSSTTLCMRYIMLIKNIWSGAFHWFSLKCMLLLFSFQLPSTPCWHPTLWHNKCTWFGHSGHALAGAVCDAWMPTVSTGGVLGRFHVFESSQGLLRHEQLLPWQERPKYAAMSYDINQNFGLPLAEAFREIDSLECSPKLPS